MSLALSHVSKSFPGVLALDSANLVLHPGEVHALMGENGAGKSTLIKIVTGVHRPDSGTLEWDGKPISIASPRDAIRLGIAVVHQERNLVPEFTIAENLLLEALPNRNGFVDFAAARRLAITHLRKVGLDIDPATQVKRLSVAQMQMVEIAKALSHDARVLLLDEPTASLTGVEAETLFALVRSLRDAGTAIVFVSHKLEEVLAISDRVTVLRDGRTVLTGEPIAQVDRLRLVEAMIGRAERPALPRQNKPDFDQPRLRLDHVSSSLGHRDISLTAHGGEVLGFYGLVGSGRTELARLIMGEGRTTSGTITVNGRVVRRYSVRDAIRRLGIGYVSEDRKSEGVILSLSVRRNVAITVWDTIASIMGFLRRADETRVTTPLTDRLEVRTPTLDQTVENLSGGNQQKIAIAKWLAADVGILIMDEPTVGVDIKAKAYIHELINGLADSGKSIILISSDMQEMIGLADRIAVFQNFAVIDLFDNDRRYEFGSRRIMNGIQQHARQSDIA